MPGRTPAIRIAIDSLDPGRDFVICDSHSTKRDLLEFCELSDDRITVVPLAADEVFTRPDTKAGSRRLEQIGVAPGSYLLALAQSEPRKNIPRLIEAYRRSRCGHDLALVLVCVANHAATLHRVLTECGGDDPAIHVVTGVDDATLSGLLSSSVAFLYVPLYEGFGIPILEAMAAGCPVVTANNSSIPEVACDAVRYVEAEDVASIAIGVEEVARNPTLRAELSSRGRERAAHFSWRRTADETLTVYRQALAHDERDPAGPADQIRCRTTRASAASRPSRGKGRHISS
jgi:alpha-1,3-rhamnosyl/mannosyltransferase